MKQNAGSRDSRRLSHLDTLQVLDGCGEALFDGLADAAAALTGASIAVIGLVDGERHWLKAVTGLPWTGQVVDLVAPWHGAISVVFQRRPVSTLRM